MGIIGGVQDSVALDHKCQPYDKVYAMKNKKKCEACVSMQDGVVTDCQLGTWERI